MGKPRWWMSMIALVGAMLVAPPAAAQSAEAPIEDPVPEAIQANLGLVLEEFVQFPETEPFPAPVDRRLMRHARINYIGEVPDGSGRLFVPDLNGPMYLVKNREPYVYLDLAEEFTGDFFSGRGLGSGFGFVTFHPEYATNGKFYTVHSEGFGALTAKQTTYPPQTPTFLHSVVTEWTATDPAADTFAGTRREIIRLGMGTQIHGIQQIEFNPTAKPSDADYGLLYLAVGDGGRGIGTGIPQNMGVPHGKILRIDPAGNNGPNGQYGIPVNNPFVSSAGALGEIYAVGMRDPHRFSWDPAGNHRMFLGHIGEHAIEAVYEVRAGDNYGWGEREGKYVFKTEDRCNLYPLPKNDAEFGFTYPVAAYDHNPLPGWPCTSDSGYAISAGFVYRGNDLPALQGKFLFTDLVQGRVFYTRESQMRRGDEEAQIYELALYDTDGKRKRMHDFVGDERADLRFGTDLSGNLYLVAKANGKAYKIVDTRRGVVTSDVHPTIQNKLVSYYDFENPFQQDGTVELDNGLSRTRINLVNGGEEMRVKDGAYPASNNSIQLGQLNPTVNGNDDWKAGVFDAKGVATLEAFNGAKGITIMGWVKMTGPNPSPNSTTANPADYYNAVGLAGILSGDSDGHAVRALLELIQVDGELRLVALGRRIDGGASQTFAASEDWQALLPQGEWVHLAATFDYTTGEMALYRNGKPIDGFYTVAGDPWRVNGEGTSPTTPRGFKIGGSFPQNTLERNPCNCRMDALMFLNTAATPQQVRNQYRLMAG